MKKRLPDWFWDCLYSIHRGRGRDFEIDLYVPTDWIDKARGTRDQANSLVDIIQKRASVQKESARRFVAELRAGSTLGVSPCGCRPAGEPPSATPHQERTHAYCANYATVRGKPHPITFWKRIGPTERWVRVTWDDYISTPYAE